MLHYWNDERHCIWNFGISYIFRVSLYKLFELLVCRWRYQMLRLCLNFCNYSRKRERNPIHSNVALNSLQCTIIHLLPFLLKCIVHYLKKSHKNRLNRLKQVNLHESNWKWKFVKLNEIQMWCLCHMQLYKK